APVPRTPPPAPAPPPSPRPSRQCWSFPPRRARPAADRPPNRSCCPPPARRRAPSPACDRRSRVDLRDAALEPADRDLVAGTEHALVVDAGAQIGLHRLTDSGVLRRQAVRRSQGIG